MTLFCCDDNNHFYFHYNETTITAVNLYVLFPDFLSGPEIYNFHAFSVFFLKYSNNLDTDSLT